MKLSPEKFLRLDALIAARADALDWKDEGTGCSEHELLPELIG